MKALLIVLGLGGLWLLIEYRQKSMVVPSSGVSVGVSAPAVNEGVGVAEETATDSEVQGGITAAAKATASIPIVGQLAGAAAAIAGIFTASHTAAVAKEAQTINSALPTFLADVEATMAGLNEGAITPAQAIAYLQEAQTNYYTTVSGIIKKGGPCKTPNLGSVAGNDQCPINNNSLWKDCASTGNCNASCAVGCGMVEPTVIYLTKIINNGGGTFTIPSSPDNGAIQGTPSITITYTRYIAPQAIPSLAGLGSTLEADLHL
jgi:hypothetical protein